jgi:two-component system CitB family response regulator
VVTHGVLVVDDDFRVAEIHGRYVAGVGGLHLTGTAHNAADALRLVAERAPELVLLDNYLPDRPGVDVAAELACDVFMVTADRAADTVRAAFRAGVLNYVIKPFPASLLSSRLAAYVRYRAALDAHPGELDQPAVDRAVATLHQADRASAPKGQSPVTARLVADTLRSAPTPLAAADVALTLGISRATAQRYLAALADSGRAAMTMRYGSTGRPEHLYSWLGG